MPKHTHKTKDGKTAKKGLYYNINKRKKLVHLGQKRNLLFHLMLIKICKVVLRRS